MHDTSYGRIDLVRRAVARLCRCAHRPAGPHICVECDAISANPWRAFADKRAAWSVQTVKPARVLFRNEAGCGTCHQSPHLTDALSGPDRRVPFLHDPAEVGTDPAYALRTATGQYRTTPLRGLWQHAPYFHDGSSPDLRAVVNHYNRQFQLNLTRRQKADLVEFLKSL
jgi:cytochrome c peroxidase